MTAKRKMEKDFAKLALVLYGKTYELSKLTKTIQSNCALHGLCQKLVDSTAGMNSKDYTDAERGKKIDEVWVILTSGQWKKPSEGKISAKKIVDEAKVKATPEELAVLKKLLPGLM